MSRKICVCCRPARRILVDDIARIIYFQFMYGLDGVGKSLFSFYNIRCSSEDATRNSIIRSLQTIACSADRAIIHKGSIL